MASPSDIHKQFVDAWNKRDWVTFRNLLHPEYTYTPSFGQEQQGPDAGVAAAKAVLPAFSDAQTQINILRASGETSYGEFLTQGTQTGPFMGVPASGKKIALRRCNVIEIRDDLIYRERDYTDMMSLMVQIGAIKPPGT